MLIERPLSMRTKTAQGTKPAGKSRTEADICAAPPFLTLGGRDSHKQLVDWVDLPFNDEPSYQGYVPG